MHLNENQVIIANDKGKARLSFYKTADGKFMTSLCILDSRGHEVCRYTPKKPDIPVSSDVAVSAVAGWLDNGMIDEHAYDWAITRYWETKNLT